MAIYGTAVLSFCVVVGIIVGKWIGGWVGLDTNVGGVGIAMFLLIFISHHLRKTGHLPPPSEKGILFWSSIYIPIVVAVAATQNVRDAVHGGPMALTAGILVVIAGFALVPVISRSGKSDDLPGG